MNTLLLRVGPVTTVQLALECLTPTLADVADELGGWSYNTVRAFRAGQRVPTAEARAKLVQLLRSRARELERLATRLERGR